MISKQETKFKQTEIGMIPEDWEITNVGSICWVRNGKTNSQDAIENGNYPLFDRSREIKRSNKYLFDEEAVILPGEGKDFVPKYYKGRFDLHQRAYAIGATKPDKINIKFLYYWLRKNRNYLARVAVGSTVRSLRLNHLVNFPLGLPSLPEQRAIAHILGTLDDKIELNRRMNETLEQIARAIFKSWFVDFDPVRAKAEGRPTGLPQEIEALFPDSFEDSELGQIPRGWTIKELGEVVDIIKGRSYTSNELQESTTALVTLKSFLRGGGYRQDGLKPFTGEYKPEQVVKPGELIISFTDVTQAAEVIGKPAIVSANTQFKTLVASLDVGIVRPKNESTNIPFLYLLFLTEDYQSHIYGYCSGTTVLHLDKSGIPKYRFVCPTILIIKTFLDIVKPIFSRIEFNIQQSFTLAAIRDALLPKLLSGKIRVQDAEKFLKERGL